MAPFQGIDCIYRAGWHAILTHLVLNSLGGTASCSTRLV